MKILVISKTSFPEGGAAINRLRNYLQGMAENGAEVKILCIKPTTSDNEAKEHKGVDGLIEYEYSSKTKIRSKHKIGNLALTFLGFLNSIKLLIKENTAIKTDVMFIGIMNLPLTLVYFIFAKLYNIKLIQERSEYPFITRKKTPIFKINLFIYLNFTCKLFDSFIVITDALEVYFNKYKNKRCRIYKLPILVKPDDFKLSLTYKNSFGRYIAYCGSMAGNKDGLPILLKSFSRIAPSYPHIKLVLIGSTNFQGFRNLKDDIDKYNLSSQIIFTGLVPHAQIPDLLGHSILTVLSRPDNIQAQGGFPTKLGEYLAAGKPVLVTDVGEIHQFLQDGINAFIAEPDNDKSFALKMREILNDYEKACKVAIEGKKLTLNEFNYNIQSEKLLNFLQSLNGN